MNHTSLLNFLADKIKAKSYLEIGVQQTRQNFDKINVPVKVGVDPELDAPKVLKMTSDDFFTYIKGVQGKHGTTTSYSLVFIDGWHEAEQVERDFHNSLKCLEDGGYICLHDCLPVDEITSLVPRQSKMFHGDVYKFIMKLHTIDGIDFTTYDFDNGCCVVWKDPTKKGKKSTVTYDWNTYKSIGRELMNVKSEFTI